MPTILPLGPQVQFVDAAPPPSSYDPSQYIVRLGALWLDISTPSRELLYICIASAPTLLRWVRISDLGGDFQDNIFMGKDAGLAIAAGASGNANVAIGNAALAVSTGAYENVAIGYLALSRLTEGDRNTAVGAESLRRNTKGRFNTAIGSDCLSFLEEGYSNVAIGSGALGSLVDGRSNVAIGHYSGWSLATGAYNTCIGAGADVESGVSEAIALGAGAKATANGQIALGSNEHRLSTSTSAGQIRCYLNVLLNGTVLGKLALYDV